MAASQLREGKLRDLARAFYTMRLSLFAQTSAKDWRERLSKAQEVLQKRLDSTKRMLSQACVERDKANANVAAAEAKRAEETLAATMTGLGAKLEESSISSFHKEMEIMREKCKSLKDENMDLERQIEKRKGEEKNLNDQVLELTAKLESTTRERKKLVQKTAEIFKTMAARQLKEKEAEMVQERKRLARDLMKQKDGLVADALAGSNKQILRLTQELKAQKYVHLRTHSNAYYCYQSP